MSSLKYELEFTLLGQPASKANSRRSVLIGGSPRFIKSKRALAYVKEAEWQVPRLNPLLDGDLVMEITIFYSNRRSDLDDSLILDILQGLVYENDRQVKERHVFWGLDADCPRAEIKIGRLDPGVVAERVFEGGQGPVRPRRKAPDKSRKVDRFERF